MSFAEQQQKRALKRLHESELCRHIDAISLSGLFSPTAYTLVFSFQVLSVCHMAI